MSTLSAMQADKESLTSEMAGTLSAKIEKTPAELLELKSDDTAAEVPAMLPLEPEP